MPGPEPAPGSGGAQQQQQQQQQSHQPGEAAPAGVSVGSSSKQFLFELGESYTPVKWLGKGAYGVVCSATHGATGSRVAIKKVANCFDNATDARRTLREVRLLRHLVHDNVVSLLDVLLPSAQRRARDGARDVYLVYELMDTDLHQIIRSPQALTEEHCQYFVYQVLRGLKYIHSAGILHRDLKPSNLLLNANCDLKICDFGLARAGSAEKGFMTEYVVTRWYRAPELLLSCDEYGPSIDMWSVGCIFGEMLQRKPLFCGKDYIDQLKLIFALLGTPPPPPSGGARGPSAGGGGSDPLHFVSSPKAKQWIQSLPPQAPLSLADHFGAAACSPEALDLLSKMLVIDPTQRLSVAAALKHPYVGHLHDEALEPVADRVFVADPQEDTASEAELRRMLLAECRDAN